MLTKTSRVFLVLVSGAISGTLLMTAGCDSALRAKAPAPPPVPAPAIPAVTPQPLIFAQTDVELPSPQPIPPEALPPRPTVASRGGDRVEYVIQAPPASRPAGPAHGKSQEPAHSPAQPLPAQQYPTAAPLQQAPAQQPAPAPGTAAEDAPEVLQSSEDLAKSNERIGERLNELRKRLRPFAGSRNSGEKSAASRIASFLRLADEALKRGDLRQADGLADRAQTLLRELTRE